MTGRLTRKSQQTIQDLIEKESFCTVPKTETSKYFDMAVKLKQRRQPN